MMSANDDDFADDNYTSYGDDVGSEEGVTVIKTMLFLSVIVYSCVLLLICWMLGSPTSKS